MHYARRIFTINPLATKIRVSDILRQDRRVDVRSKFSKTLRKYFANVQLYLLGKSESYAKPIFTASDCFYVMFHYLINIRWFIQYVDLTLTHGGFVVLVTYVLFNVLICSTLAFILTFFGNYGARSFINMWEMCPSFSGITMCMIINEVWKMMEMGLILSTAFMSYTLYFDLANPPQAPPADINANCTDPEWFTFMPGWATPYGISEQFNAFGYITDKSNEYANWRYNPHCGRLLLIGWSAVIFIRFFQFKRYRVFPVRIMAFSMILLFLALLTTAVLLSTSPAISIVYSNSYTVVYTYMQIFAFCINDYLPSHWVTIGYLHPNIQDSCLIWTMIIFRIFVGAVIYFAIPYFMEYFCEYVHCTNDTCLQTYGVHFFFVVIPVAIYQTMNVFVGYVVYHIYVCLVVMDGVCYLLTTLEMFCIAVAGSQHATLLYRFRNMFFILMCLIIYGLSQPLCVNAIHFILCTIAATTHYYVSGIIFTLMMLAFYLYGLGRINADHHYYFGYAYRHLPTTRLLIVISLLMLAVYLLDFALFIGDRSNMYAEYWVFLGIITLPFLLGTINTMAHRESYHGFIQPLVTWGPTDELRRIARRRRDLWRMLAYHTHRECFHGCLHSHPALKEDVDAEITLRFELLQERVNYFGLLMPKDARELQYLPGS